MTVISAASAHADQVVANQPLADRINQLANIGQNPDGSLLYSIDRNPVVGAPIVGGSFPGSILLPSTETSVRISGRIGVAVDYFMTGGNPNAQPSNIVGADGQLNLVPLQNTTARARSNGIFWVALRESRIGFEMRTPTPLGEARTVLEFDWGGSTVYAPGGADPLSVSNNLLPRVRYAYGTLGGFLAGQATSNFTDPDAGVDVLDGGGNIGGPGVIRIPQVRYTIPDWWGASVSVSAETPETDLGTPAGIVGSDAGVTGTVTTACSAAAPGSTAATCTSTLLPSGPLPTNIAKATAPDLTAAWYLPQPWGHLDLSLVLRPGMEIDDGKYFAKNYVGYGGHFSFDVKPGWFGWTKDHLVFNFTAGNGIGRYVDSFTNFAIATTYGANGGYGAFGGPMTSTAAALVRATTTDEFGSRVGYQHWWLDNLRSNISYGINRHQIPVNLVGATQAGSMNKELQTAHANLIWSPVSSVDIGLEYMWGHRVVVNNLKGDENVLISKFVFRF